MIFLIRRAVGGIRMPRAFSTALIEARAWTTVQTPHILCAKSHASLGSLPLRIISIPRNIVAHEKASVMHPLSVSTSTSIRRWPSILVTGSTTTLAIFLPPFPPTRAPESLPLQTRHNVGVRNFEPLLYA